MTSEEKVRNLFKEVSLDQSFFNRVVYDERYLYRLFMCEATRHELERIYKMENGENNESNNK